VDRVKK